jgi:hypothetical protein
MKRSVVWCVVLALAVAWVGGTALAQEEEKIKTYYRLAHSGSLAVNKPIEIGADLRGIKLESTYFTDNEVLVVVWNRTPVTAHINVGVALFDAKGNLMAAEAASKMLGVRSGKQGNFKVKFKKFLSDFTGVAQFKVVMALVI